MRRRRHRQELACQSTGRLDALARPAGRRSGPPRAGRQPPRQVVLSFLVGADWTPEPDPTRASEIDVRFLAEAPDRTRLEFEHRHLERYGEQAERMCSVLDGPNGAVGLVIAYAAAAGRP